MLGIYLKTAIFYNCFFFRLLVKTPKCENIPSDFVIMYSELKGNVTALTLQLLDSEPCRGQEGQ